MIRIWLALLLPLSSFAADAAVSGVISTAAYPSIQEALAANPNKQVFVPAGDHVISEKIRIRGTGSGLCGPGRIIQQNAEQPIIEIENSRGVEIKDLTLTRPEGKTASYNEAVRAQNCDDLVIDNVRVINNQTKSGVILLTDSRNTRISRCLVRN